MAPRTFIRRSAMPVSAEALARWHEDPSVLELLTPPWEKVELVEHSGGVRDGDRALLRLHLGPFKLHWEALHEAHVPGRQFRDRQLRGPFASWVHTHRFLPETDTTSTLEDAIEYRLPGGPVVNFLLGGLVDRRLRRTFEYRHRVTREALIR